jgi:hypothetical protein
MAQQSLKPVSTNLTTIRQERLLIGFLLVVTRAPPLTVDILCIAT